MTQVGYLILAVSILVALLVIFFVSFVLYKRTPVPKGCEDVVASEEKCSSCNNHNCRFNSSKEENE